MIVYLIDMVLSQVNRVADLFHLLKLETKLAARTLVLIAILSFILSSVITVSWLSICIWLFFYLVSLHYSYLYAWSIITVINVGIMIILIAYLYSLKKRLSLPTFRRRLKKKGLLTFFSNFL